MYTYKNYRTKKAFEEDVIAGKDVKIFQPGGMFTPPEASPSYTGKAYVEGPHFPLPHRWYAEVDVVEGRVVRVK